MTIPEDALKELATWLKSPHVRLDAPVPHDLGVANLDIIGKGKGFDWDRRANDEILKKERVRVGELNAYAEARREKLESERDDVLSKRQAERRKTSAAPDKRSS